MAQGYSNIKFLGHESGDRLRTLYEQAVATIVPSIWYEVFGIIILESFARATPAIVRNIGGMPKVIEESGGGFVFNTDEELLHAMDRLIEEPGLRGTNSAAKVMPSSVKMDRGRSHSVLHRSCRESACWNCRKQKSAGSTMS